MNTGYSFYQIYQAERTRSAAEQRRTDDDHGELAAAVSRRWRRITAPLRSLRRPAYPAQDEAPSAVGQPEACLVRSGR
jgi:hypothetical protein